MSISKFQERFLSGGCAKTVVFVMAAAFIGSLFYGTQCNHKSGQMQAQAELGVAARVGETPIYAADLEKSISDSKNEMLSQMTQPGQPAPAFVPPFLEVQAGLQAISTQIDRAALIAVATKAGVSFSDEALRTTLNGQLDQQIEMFRLQLQMANKLKTGATEAEFAAAFEKEAGRSLTDAKTEFTQRMEEQIKDPAQRPMMMAAVASSSLLEQYKKQSPVSEDLLKLYVSNLEYKRIVLSGPTAAEDAAKVLADLTAKTKTFEQAMDADSKEPAPAGKKRSETTFSLSGAAVLTTESYKDLRNLKVGETSGVVTGPEGASIYKLVKVTPNPPKDFDKQKEQIRGRLAETLASNQLQAAIEEYKKANPVKWEMPTYQALYDLSAAMRDAKLTGADRDKKLIEVMDAAKAAMSSGKPGAQAAALAQYGAMLSLSPTAFAKPEEGRTRRIEVLQDLLAITENPGTRLELVDLALQAKDKDLAFENLSAAARTNNAYDMSGQQTYSEVASKLQQLKTAGLITPEQEKEIEAEQQQWRTAKIENDRAIAQAKAEEEAARKKAEQQLKAEEAAAKKEAADRASQEKAKAGSSSTPK